MFPYIKNVIRTCKPAKTNTSRFENMVSTLLQCFLQAKVTLVRKDYIHDLLTDASHRAPEIHVTELIEIKQQKSHTPKQK